MFHNCHRRQTPDGSWTLYRVAIKADLYHKPVQVYHIASTAFYLRSSFRFELEPPFEQPLNTRLPSLSCHQANQTGLFSLSARCYKWKIILISIAATWDRTCVTGEQSVTLLYKPACTTRQYKLPYIYHYFSQNMHAAFNKFIVLIFKDCHCGQILYKIK